MKHFITSSFSVKNLSSTTLLSLGIILLLSFFNPAPIIPPAPETIIHPSSLLLEGFHWEEDSIEIKAESLDKFQEVLRNDDDYDQWLHKCKRAVPLDEYDQKNEIKGYFGFLYDSPIFTTHVICWSELKIINKDKMTLFLKKKKPPHHLNKKWKKIVKKHTGFLEGILAKQIDGFDGVWIFSKIGINRYKVKLKVGIKAPNKLVKKTDTFQKFVEDVVQQTLKKLKKTIEETD